MSSENYVGIIMAENLRFLGEGSSAQGKPGAKARPRGVVDAHTVEIPWPPKNLSTGTHWDILMDMVGERRIRGEVVAEAAVDCIRVRMPE